MLYLEDYLEMIEHLPQHFRDTLTQMRELDLQVHNDMDNWQIRVNKFFNNAPIMAPENRDAQFEQMKQDYFKALEAAEEKVATANHVYDLVDKYLRKLEQELHKFKIELEADNAGITEILEKRSLELDNPPASSSSHREKRKLGFGPLSEQKLNSDKGFNNYVQDSYGSSLAVQYGSSKNQNNLQLSSQLNPLDNANCFSFFNAKLTSDRPSLNTNKLKVTIPGNALATAASQAIAATQQMQLGRRTASLKASYEAINSGFPNFNLNSLRMDDSDSNNYLKNSYDVNDSDKANKKARLNKKNRTSSLYNPELSNSTSSDALNNADPLMLDEPRYCVCNNVSYGEMIYCENKQCPYGQWFHYECVQISRVPKGSWYCASCMEQKRKNKNPEQTDKKNKEQKKKEIKQERPFP